MMSAPQSSSETPVPMLEAPDSALVRRVVASPNHGERRDGVAVDMIVLHYTGMPAGRGMTMAERAITWLSMPEAQVSAHYVVDEDGTIVQMVAEHRRAWHAGLSCWAGVRDLNSCSIGIEIAHAGHPWEGIYPDDPDRQIAGHPGLLPFPAPQIEAVIALVADIATRFAIAPERILAHSDIAPRRKTDPGEGFPWDRLHAAGLGHYVPPAPIGGGRFFQLGDAGAPIEALQAMFGLYGYDLEVTGTFDEATKAVVTAFQRHFRPALVDGIADRSTIETLNTLLRSRPSVPVA